MARQTHLRRQARGGCSTAAGHRWRSYSPSGSTLKESPRTSTVPSGKTRSTQRTRRRSTRGLRELAAYVAEEPGFCALIDALRTRRWTAIDGVWGSSTALVTAALRRHAPGALVVVLPHVRDLDAFAQDLETFGAPKPDQYPAAESGVTGTATDASHALRLRTLVRLADGAPPPVLLMPVHALLQPVPAPDELRRRQLTLRVNQTLPMEQLLEWLQRNGFRRVEVVEVVGEYSVRGGIVDLFAPNATEPVRVEFFDEEIESLRYFDPETQRSSGLAEQVALQSMHDRSTELDGTAHIADYWPESTWWVLIEPFELRQQAQSYLNRLAELKGHYLYDTAIARVTRQYATVSLSSMPAGGDLPSWTLRTESVQRFSGRAGQIRAELEASLDDDTDVLIACHNEAERARLEEIFRDSPLWRGGRLRLEIGMIQNGFRLVLPAKGRRVPRRRVLVISDNELLQRTSLRRPAPRRGYETRVIESFLDLKEGDYVVHVAHGIARYRGLQLCERHGSLEEHLVLEFAEGTRVLVPSSRIELVQKYVGGRGHEPPLSKYGSSAWQRRKAQVAEAVRDLAAEMLRLQALRLSRPGISYAEESEWLAEFEASFPFQETPDQLRAIQEIKHDMAQPRPMDRLLCGDVGFGKTELAMRAAFKAVDHGKQVAVLVPTTVLAEQHYRTFTERFAAFPFEIEVLSRFKSKAEQQEIVERLRQGTIDIIIGTHRLLQRDIEFHDLGLVIIDEEQRFGVAHKERLKSMRATVDVLTLTATPIPRTLHMALLGIRDISVLETPPLDRQAVETHICRWDDELIRHAILRELNRDGQVFFVHNRVYNIHLIAQRIQQLVPEATVRYAHGQMPPHELETTMLAFFDRKFDVLVATTIIENGLDVPTANTIFINDADRFGLAELHQLRGRVGRYKHRAYAYLLVDPTRSMTEDARQRLKAIEEFNELGAGFKLAMRDLEIRGAGNILGPQQSGHIAAVGYELYCQLLEQAVRELKKEPAPQWIPVVLDLPWKAYLPDGYVPAHRQRIELYRKFGQVRTLDAVDDLATELRDRFGSPPPAVQNLLQAARLRVLCQPWSIQRISLRQDQLVITFATVRGAQALQERLGDRLRLADELTGHLLLEAQQTSASAVTALLEEALRDPPSDLMQAA